MEDREFTFLEAHAVFPIVFMVGIVLLPFSVLYRLYNQAAALLRFLKIKRLAKPYTGETRKCIDRQIKEIKERDLKHFSDTFWIALMFCMALYGAFAVISPGFEKKDAVTQEIAILTSELNRPEKSVWAEMFSADLGYAKARLPQAQTERNQAALFLFLRFYGVFMIGGFLFHSLSNLDLDIRFSDPTSESYEDLERRISQDKRVVQQEHYGDDEDDFDDDEDDEDDEDY